MSGEDLQRLDVACGGSGFLALVARYSQLVASLDGYDFSIYEYDNDVSVRESLEAAIASVSGDTQIGARALLAGLDAGFRTLTHEVRRSRGSKTVWSLRIPRHPGPELKSDIAAGNL